MPSGRNVKHSAVAMFDEMMNRITLLERRLAVGSENGATVPVGAMTAFSGPNVPNGWLLCNGATLLRANYPALFAVVGTIYGAGDGSTTFRIPNLQGRTLVGGLVGDANFGTLGQVGGSKTETLTTAQVPTQEGWRISWGAAGNVHFDNVQAIAGPSSGNGIYTQQNNPAWGGTVGGQPHNNLQPYSVVNYIVFANA